ncbi:hypothetical protein [Luteimonas qiangzhengi]|uniref:hypothetical protein n=1 Tax=Luteimonas sp. MJ146 TaxID=3129240 RepID=UPI0031BB7FBA
MPLLSKKLLWMLPIAAVLVLCSPAHAQRLHEQRVERMAEERVRQQQPQQQRQQQAPRRQAERQDSMADSIRHVRRANRGQILSAERMHSGGREINRIKMVDDRGRVRVFEDDPQQRRSQRSRGDDD